MSMDASNACTGGKLVRGLAIIAFAQCLVYAYADGPCEANLKKTAVYGCEEGCDQERLQGT